jgi:hypothetical protein
MEQNTQILRPHLPGFIGLVRESLQVYRNKWLILLKIVMASYAVMLLTACAGIAIVFVCTLFVPAKNAYLLIVALMFVIFFVLISIIISSWFGAATIVVLRDWQEALTIREAMRRAKPYILSYLWINILSLLLIVPGFILFIVPGVLLMIWFSFSRYVLFFDKERGIAALLKSREYARDYFWSIFLLSLTAIASSLFIDAVLRPLDGLPLGGLAHAIINIFISLLESIYFYLIFNHLRTIKGDSLPAQSSVQKNIFCVIATIGLLLAIAVAGLAIYFAPEIKTNIETKMQKIQSQQNNGTPIPSPQKTI